MATAGRVLAAPATFTGTVTAADAADAVHRAARAAGWTCDRAPVADGGEGTLEAFGGTGRPATPSRDSWGD